MKCNERARFECAAAVLLVLAAATPLWAQIGASRNYGNPSVQSEHDLTIGPEGLGWYIGSPQQPVDVILDPDAGPWIKNLRGPDGGPVVANDLCGQQELPGCFFQLNEVIHIAGQLSWTDFHEEVITPGWNISGQILANGLPVPGLTNELMFTDGVTSGGAVWWFFDPLPPSTVLTLTKTLHWVGKPLVIGEGFVGTIQVAQYPTIPEPASVALVAMAAMALVMRRRLRRS